MNKDKTTKSHSDVATRRAMERDIPRLLEMIGELAAHHGDRTTLTGKHLERDAFGPCPWITLIVAERGDTVVGYSALCPLIKLQFGARGIDLHHLFVDPAFRGQGVGGALIRASFAEAFALDCEYMMVGTHPDNEAAQQMYLANGFEPVPAFGPRFRIRVPELSAEAGSQD